MTKPKRRGVVADPEIIEQAKIAAGVLATIFGVDRDDLLKRPRPSGLLRNVRDLMIGILHFKTGFSQQKIAAALGRDRGVVSDAAHAIDEASTGDVVIRFAIVEMSEQIANIMTQAEAWKEAMEQETLDAAIRKARDERDDEEAEDADLEVDIAAAKPAAAITMRCHQCYGKGKVRIHGLGGDPAYRAAWEAAERRAHAADGFHTLTCRFCNGAGQRGAKPATTAGAAILAGARE